MLKRNILTFAAIGLSSLLLACGSTKKTNSSTTTKPALSTGFASNCATCHGADGTSTTYKVIKGTTVSLDTFKSNVRNGKGAMTAIPVSKYSDADLQNDYTALSGN